MRHTMRIAGLLVVLAIAVQAGPRLVVFDLQPVGVDSSVTTLATMLFRDRLVDTDSFRLVGPLAEVAVQTVEEAAVAATGVGADLAIVGSVAQIAHKMLISYKLVNVATGGIELSDRVTISSMEDMDLTLERMALAIARRESFTQTGEMGTYTRTEIGQRAAMTSFFLVTGYTYPMQHQFPGDPGSMLFTLEAAVSYETPDILAQGIMGYRRGKYEYRELYFDLLVHRLFSRSDVSPYLGGGIGVHQFTISPPGQYELEDDGLALIGSAGIILFRSQFFRIVGGLRATAVVTEDWGVNYLGSFNFGLSSPPAGPGGDLDIPVWCTYGCLGAFFLTGLIVAATT